eukprot:scaffold137230_cov18-Tisochrysis_lutea.AAC.2
MVSDENRVRSQPDGLRLGWARESTPSQGRSARSMHRIGFGSAVVHSQPDCRDQDGAHLNKAGRRMPCRRASPPWLARMPAKFEVLRFSDMHTLVWVTLA